MFYKIATYTISISILFLGCASLNKTASQNSTQTISKSKYTSQSGYYYALMQKDKEGWKIIDIKETPITNRADRNQEIIQVDESFTNLDLYFPKNKSLNLLNSYDCENLIFNHKYNPCSSNFSKHMIGKNTLNFFKFNSSSYYKSIDKELIAKVAKESNLFKAIEEKKATFELERYKREFDEAKTADDYNNFILKYLYLNDESNLITLARQKRDNIYIQEQNKLLEEAKRLTRENELKEIRQNKIDEIKAKETIALSIVEESTRKSHKSKIENFRKNLKSGIETNCGPIIETKDSLVKVYFPLKNYGDEHWLDANKVFPKKHGCCFVKGKYIAPPAF